MLPEQRSWSSAEILALRGLKNRVDPWRPYAYLVEPERSANDEIVEIATLFLTNRECPFRCLMCDLWQNTTNETVPLGAIPAQIEYALARLPPAGQIKLYNSGNFFDPRAVPFADHPAIAARVRAFSNVIVENHPRFCDSTVVRFRDLLQTKLEVAIGLETIHPEVLPALNKQMTVESFDAAAGYLARHDIALRVFLLLRPPLLDEEAGIAWAIRSLEHAFAQDATCCTIIPTRAGNGMMEHLQRAGLFEPPSLAALEQVLAAGLQMQAARVFVDLWDAARLRSCAHCAPQRIERLQQMNLSQKVLPQIICEKGAACESMSTS